VLCSFAAPEMSGFSASFRLLGENSPLFRAATFRFNADNRTSDPKIIPQTIKKINNFLKNFSAFF